ncbi:MAG: hypothetical protein OQK82_09120 [Candidatus Pacearchaeota archaeon]|nr:hypothetical protein [Candidatus Pacearchaeota archaeon]
MLYYETFKGKARENPSLYLNKIGNMEKYFGLDDPEVQSIMNNPKKLEKIAEKYSSK